jgi:hypothetical protein
MMTRNLTARFATCALAGFLLATLSSAAGENLAPPASVNALATGAHSPTGKLSGAARIKFQGSSTLHDFEGHVMSQPFDLILSPNSWSAKASVFGGEMTTANAKRDKNMWAMLATNLHPRLEGEIRDAPRPPLAGTNTTLALKIRDTKMDLPVKISNWSETAEGVRFDAEWIVSLKAYGLKPPSVAGVIRVGDTVRLQADIVATNVQALTKPAGPEVNSSKP